MNSQPPNKFQKAWMKGLAAKLPPAEYSEAINYLLGDPEIRDRINSAEIRDRGSGAGAAMIEYSRWKKRAMMTFRWPGS